jgi:hypothetical protein
MDTAGSDPVGFETIENDGANFRFEIEVKVRIKGIVGLTDEKARGGNFFVLLYTKRPEFGFFNLQRLSHEIR